MELEEFISKTLISIAKGMKSANEETKLEDGRVLFTIEPVSWYKDRTDGCIKFDVAVTASKESGLKGGGGIRIWSIGLDGKKEVSTSDQIVSRIKFNIAPQVTVA